MRPLEPAPLPPPCGRNNWMAPKRVGQTYPIANRRAYSWMGIGKTEQDQLCHDENVEEDESHEMKHIFNATTLNLKVN